MDSFYFGFKKMHAKCLRKVPKEFQIGSGPTSMYCEGSIVFEGIMLRPTSKLKQLQHCTSYAAATALHQAPIRDFITATTQINIYIFFLQANSTTTYYSSIKKDTILLICINCLLKKYKVALKIKRTLTITNFELQQNSINCEFHKYNLQAPKKKKKKS